MGAKLKRIWAGYQKYRMITHIIAAIAGASAGISACGTYSKVYHNYHAGSWAGSTAAFAILFLLLHISVLRDREKRIRKEVFYIYLALGLLGFVGGLIGLITYLALAAHNKESGMPADGYYVVVIWNAFTLKWGLFTAMAARKFKKKYFDDSQADELVQNV